MVLPEDDANRQIANGFHQQITWTRLRQMQVLPVAGGWKRVLTEFQSAHVPAMNRCGNRYMILLIDFDGRVERLQEAKAEIPAELTDRVFILGTLSNPENLRAELGAYEQIGAAMASDCRDGTDIVWGHALLHHNESELHRLRDPICEILFPSAVL